MKKILFIFSTLSIISCNKLKDETPKCDDENVKNTAIQIVKDHYRDSYIKETAQLSIENIRTNYSDDNSKSCGCTGNFRLLNYDEIQNKYIEKNGAPLGDLLNVLNDINYNVQKSTEGDVNVEIIKN